MTANSSSDHAAEPEVPLSSSAPAAEEEGRQVKQPCKYSVQCLLDKYNAFQLENEVSKVRSKVNDSLSTLDPVLKAIAPLAHDPFEYGRQLTQRTYELSEDMNKRSPYAASLCRSHGSLVVGGSMAAVAISGRMLRLPTKPLLFLVLTTYVAVQGSCSLFNFKWNNPQGPRHPHRGEAEEQ